MKKRIFLYVLLLSALTVQSQTTILDFETAATSTTFQYFGNVDLSDQLNQVIANPNASGINTSSMVSEHIKRVGSEPWAGMFSNPDPMTPLDLTTSGQICIDVHMDHIGSVLVKLEQGNAGDWEQSVSNTVANEWEQLCVDVTMSSGNGDPVVAFGNTYNRLTLFFDFGVSPEGEDEAYYIDNVVTVPAVVSNEDITFAVDMNEYPDAFTTVYVSGSFNGWNGESNPMSDEDGDGIWTATFPLPTGPHEYKYTLDNWAVQEEFAGGEECTVTNDGFTNRSLTVVETTTLETVCWNSCYACGEGVVITVNLGTSNISVSPEGVYIAGGGTFGIPGDFPLTDPDGDGVYTIVISKPVGFSSFYTFANGACGDFSCKENIAGQDCANPDNFNDRFMGPITQDTVINTCFGLCTTDTNCGVVTTSNITFQADMSNYEDPFTTAYVSGSFNGWSGEANPMSDDDGDGIWETTLPLAEGSYQYKISLDNWAVQEEFMAGMPCTVLDGDFVNRGLQVGAEDATYCFQWNTCETCVVGTNELITANDIFTVQPTIANSNTTLAFNTAYGNEKELSIVNALGQLLEQRQIPYGASHYQADLSQLQSGLYFFRVITDGKQQIQRVIVQH